MKFFSLSLLLVSSLCSATVASHVLRGSQHQDEFDKDARNHRFLMGDKQSMGGMDSGTSARTGTTTTTTTTTTTSGRYTPSPVACPPSWGCPPSPTPPTPAPAASNVIATAAPATITRSETTTAPPTLFDPSQADTSAAAGSCTIPTPVSEYYAELAALPGSGPDLVPCSTNDDCADYKSGGSGTGPVTTGLPRGEPCCIFPRCLCGYQNPTANAFCSAS